MGQKDNYDIKMMMLISGNTMILNVILAICMLCSSLIACNKKVDQGPVDEPPIDIPAGDVSVGVYYFPNWGPVFRSEWQLIRDAQPRFSGHKQPKKPLWGFENEENPQVMAKKIDVAAQHGVDAFIFCWYYFDPANLERPGGKYLSEALENGFMPASNAGDVSFALMWANHDVGDMKGAIAPETFEEMTTYIVEHYFNHSAYWKIDGNPYFSIYEFDTFLKIFDNDVVQARNALERFREKVKAAGFPDLHLNLVLWGLKGELLSQAFEIADVSSTTSYVWIHHNVLQGFPTAQYDAEAHRYFNSVAYGGASNGLQNPAHTLPVPYYPNVTMGWDASPRTRNAADWNLRRDYPFGAVMVGNTPYVFKRALAQAKRVAIQNESGHRIVTVNAWNEWGEGSYLEPDTESQFGYLEALKEVFEQE